jgi:hypothetical protein
VRDVVFRGSRVYVHFDVGGDSRMIAEVGPARAEEFAKGRAASIAWSIVDTLAFSSD